MCSTRRSMRWTKSSRSRNNPSVSGRSEEHTSELQSHSDLLCRLLPSSPTLYTLSLHDALPIWRPRDIPQPAGIRVLALRLGWLAIRVEVTPRFPLSVLAETCVPRAARCVGPNRLVRAIIRASAADRKSTRLNSSHTVISYAVFCPRRPLSTLFPYTTLFRSGALEIFHNLPVSECLHCGWVGSQSELK